MEAGLRKAFRIREQRLKTFLLKVPVVSENVRNPSRRIVCIEMQSVRL